MPEFIKSISSIRGSRQYVVVLHHLFWNKEHVLHAWVDFQYFPCTIISNYFCRIHEKTASFGDMERAFCQVLNALNICTFTYTHTFQGYYSIKLTNNKLERQSYKSFYWDQVFPILFTNNGLVPNKRGGIWIILLRCLFLYVRRHGIFKEVENCCNLFMILFY